ncbi:MAG: histidinol dehydrogenase [Glaciecola sp.]|jgi:histidinol dehydrogenase
MTFITFTSLIKCRFKMKVYKYPQKSEWPEILSRPVKEKANLDQIVNEVFEAVKTKGDQAVAFYTSKFDQSSPENVLINTIEVEKAVNAVSNELKDAIDLAYNNILAFHNNQIFDESAVETTPGVTCWRTETAIEKVGLYIPGGTAPLFSTVLMLGVPAKIADCPEIILCTPPDKSGNIHPAILYTANKIGISKIYKVGGIQAIAAMTYGTDIIPAVYKIFGPGNQFVTAAKEKATTEGIAIDMPAGPSEVLVYADKSASPAFIASDLLSQAEHGIDSQSILVCTDETVLENTKQEVAKQLAQLSRKDIAAQSLENSTLVLVDNVQEAMEMINEYAPEHFIVMSEDEEYIINNIRNAGSVFLGDYTPESAGDYASGTNHTLPTNGFAKAYSGVSLESFNKKITFQRISKQGLKNIGPAIEIMAENELLDAHKNAVTIRLNKGLKDLNK